MTGQKNIKIVFTNIIFPLKISFNQGTDQPSQISAILIAGPSKWTNCWTVPTNFPAYDAIQICEPLKHFPAK